MAFDLDQFRYRFVMLCREGMTPYNAMKGLVDTHNAVTARINEPKICGFGVGDAEGMHDTLEVRIQLVTPPMKAIFTERFIITRETLSEGPLAIKSRWCNLDLE